MVARSPGRRWRSRRPRPRRLSHIAKAVAATVDGQPRLARDCVSAVVQETRPLAAFGLPVNAAVEAGSTAAAESGLLVSKVVIPSPAETVFEQIA